MRSLLLVATAAIAAARLPHPRGKGHHRGFKRPHRVEPKGTLNDIADPRTGGYTFDKTIPYWTDKLIRDRGEPPYRPPADWVYNTNAGPVEGKINVHLVPHTHDDTGWQVTVDQYFYTDVYYILDTVIPRLAEDPHRKFIYVEIGFFARWWDQQSEKKKDLTRSLVKNGQLEFINGAWCMHDEASPAWVEMVDQTTRGHQFLIKNFGRDALPRGTWQIDPFGHSNTQAWLLGAEAGFESMFWGRTDYQDLKARVAANKTEWVWRGSQSLGSTAELFAGEIYGGGGGGYGTWISFNGNDNQVQDDPSRHDYNVDMWVDKFVQAAISQANHTRTEHQMWACGSDFQYQNADHWYHNLDKLIHYVNLNGTVNAMYSTPSLYVDQKHKAGLVWEARADDIFPLADNDHHYWSGYFTSRPALKRQVRFATNFLNAARQLEVITKTTKDEVPVTTVRPAPPVGDSWTDSLEGTIGVATHHDGMSGTERQDVSDDYEQRISESHEEVEAGVAASLQKLLGSDVPLSHCNCNEAGNCLNISVCAFTSGGGLNSFSVVAYNPLGQASTQLLRVPVTGASWSVAANGKAIPSQVIALDERTLSLPLLYINSHGMNAAQKAAEVKKLTNQATHVLVFEAAMPPVGYSTFTATRGTSLRTVSPRRRVRTGRLAVRDKMVVANDMFELQFDTQTGMLSQVTNKKSGVTTPLSISWGWYNSSVGGCTAGVKKSCDGQKSGAYIFRPNSSTVFYPGPPSTPKLTVVNGSVVTEVYQQFSSWATHVVRLVQGQPYIEVEWTAGPIPVNTPWIAPVAHDRKGNPMPNMWGKEVIVKYSTGIESAGSFQTDSNGREMVNRRFNQRGPSYPPLEVNEPVAGNYYPVNNMIAIQDTKTQFVVVTDVSQGGSSLNKGEVELMVHRRVQADDSRGVQEPLNETMCGCNDIGASPGRMGAHGHEGDGGCECAGLTMRGRHWLYFGLIEDANQARRRMIEELNFPSTLAFASGALKTAQPSYSAIAKAFPDNVKLTTLTSNYAAFNDGALMLRVAHLYSVGEHPTLSAPATISFADIFSKAGLAITNMRETTLSGNQDKAEWEAKKLHWQTDAPMKSEPYVAFDPTDSDLAVTLRPMEVRTFLVNFE